MFNKLREVVEIKKAVIEANLIYVPTKEDILVSGERLIGKISKPKIGAKVQKDVAKEYREALDRVLAKSRNNNGNIKVKTEENKEGDKAEKNVEVVETEIAKVEEKQAIEKSENDINDAKEVIAESKKNIEVDAMLQKTSTDLVEVDEEGDIDLIIKLARKIEDDEILNEDVSSLLNNNVMYDDEVVNEMGEYEDLYYDEEYEINDIENVNEDVESSAIEEIVTKEKTTLNLEAIREYIVQEELEIKKEQKANKKVASKSKVKVESKKNNK